MFSGLKKLLNLIRQLMVFDPRKRFPEGNANYKAIFDHDFFDDDTKESMESNEYKRASINSYEPSFKPRIVEVEKSQLGAPYTGNQTIFLDLEM
jgi:hypothetical protein